MQRYTKVVVLKYGGPLPWAPSIAPDFVRDIVSDWSRRLINPVVRGTGVVPQIGDLSCSDKWNRRGPAHRPMLPPRDRGDVLAFPSTSDVRFITRPAGADRDVRQDANNGLMARS